MHNGHLKLASHALAEFSLDKIIFVPSYKTPLKSEKLLPPALRLKILRKAVKANPAFSVSLCEVRRKGVSYTVDTLRVLKKALPKKSVLYFLAGGDTLKNFRRWKSPDEVLRLSRVVIFSRPGAARAKLPKGALFAPFDALDISSTQIRRRIKKGQSVRGLVPESVLEDLHG